MRPACPLIVALLLAPAPAPAWELAYEAPSECGDDEAFRARVDAELAGEPVTPAAHLEVVVTADDGGRWRVTIRDRSQEDAAKTIVGESCAQLLRAAALSVALALRATEEALTAEAPASRPVRDEPTAHEPRPRRRPSPPAEGASTRGAPSAPPMSLLRLDTRLGVGSLPSPAAALALAVAVRQGPFGLEVRGAHWPGRRAALSPSIGGTLGLQALAFLACHHARGLTSCGGLEHGRYRGSGYGLAPPVSVESPWTALVASFATEWKTSGSVVFSLTAEVVVPATRPHFVVAGTEVYRPSAVGARLGMGLGWLIP